MVHSLLGPFICAFEPGGTSMLFLRPHLKKAWLSIIACSTSTPQGTKTCKNALSFQPHRSILKGALEIFRVFLGLSRSHPTKISRKTPELGQSTFSPPLTPTVFLQWISGLGRLGAKFLPPTEMPILWLTEAARGG